MKRLSAFALLLCVLGWFAPGDAARAQAPSAGAAPARVQAKTPRLIVVVVIDQFRADYLTRFRDRLGPDGFNRLLRQGAVFSSCFYPYYNTETGPGHATLATGTTPNRHGIAANTWYDAGRGKVVESIEDESSPEVGAASRIAGVSPRNLVGTTLADELRLATQGEAKVLGVALKDRAAVLSTGHTGSGAYWYNTGTGTFVTSRYYREQLPDWVTAFNQKRGGASYYGKEWKAGGKVLGRLGPFDGKPDGRFFGELRYSPFGNDLVVDLARELVAQEKLGADSVTDFLFVGLSANDYVGHRWGPYSDESAEMTRRTDAQLAALLRFLDQQVGAGNYWLALSGDHGVAPTLEQSRARGIKAKNVEPAAIAKAIQEALAAKWGEDKWLVGGEDIFFNRETLKKHGVSEAQAAEVAGQVLSQTDGVLGYVAGEEAYHLSPKLVEAVRLSTFPQRSPDVQIVLEPFAVINGDRGGTGHGTPHSYDTHVPLILFGASFAPGTYLERASPADLAPTLAAALGINPPALADGKVLAQAVRSKPQAAAPAPR